jgi:hypothetical protein
MTDTKFPQKSKPTPFDTYYVEGRPIGDYRWRELDPLIRRSAKKAGKALARQMGERYPDLSKRALQVIAWAFTRRILRGGK